MDELNPNHKVTQGLRDQWHKLVAILLIKLNRGRDVVITEGDVEALIDGGRTAIVAHDMADGLHLRLVDDETAERLVRQSGGLPE